MPRLSNRRAMLNPQQGNDTYLPGSIGIAMSGLTIATFAGRAIINHHLTKCLRNRQLEIKHKVEAVLARLEEDNGRGTDSKNELVDLIGERGPLMSGCNCGVPVMQWRH